MGIFGVYTFIYIFLLLLTDPDRIRFDSIKEPLSKTAGKTVNSNKPVKYQDMAEISIAQFFCCSAVIFNI